VKCKTETLIRVDHWN